MSIGNNQAKGILSVVLKTIKKHRMFSAGDKVVLAVSGGPDSVALLDIFKELNIRLCLSLCVAHLDHGIRKNSGRDYKFVKNISESYGIPFFGEKVCWNGVKDSGPKEEVLRRLRYDFLFRVAERFGADSIVVAHHRDDQAETVLMRLLRGSGLHGMGAILPKRVISGHTLLRPLLEVSREDILSYLIKRQIKYVVDETNSEDKFFRNKIRNQLLPLLEKEYNSNIKMVLSSFASSAGSDYDYLSRQAEAFLKKNLKKNKGTFSVAFQCIKEIDISLRRLVLRGIIGRLRGDMGLLTFKHAEEFEDLIFCRPDLSEVHLPCCIVIKKTKNFIEFYSVECKPITGRGHVPAERKE